MNFVLHNGGTNASYVCHPKASFFSPKQGKQLDLLVRPKSLAIITKKTHPNLTKHILACQEGPSIQEMKIKTS